MGHYHGSFSKEIQLKKTRHTCHWCGQKKYEKFMDATVWEIFRWICKDCSPRYRKVQLYKNIKWQKA